MTKVIAVALLLLACLGLGCGRVESVRAVSNSASLSNAPQRAIENPAVSNAPADLPAPGMVVCTRCGGSGKSACIAQGCDHGKLDCPEPCMKASKGRWEHLEVAGHGPEELWQKFYDADGRWHAWNQGHFGEVIEIRDGKAVNVGKCKTCGGTTKVSCDVCKGTGEITCAVCGGRKTVPADVAAASSTKPKTPLKTIRLQNGTTLIGRTEMRIGKTVFIRTEQGKQVEVSAAEIVSETPIVETSRR